MAVSRNRWIVRSVLVLVVLLLLSFVGVEAWLRGSANSTWAKAQAFLKTGDDAAARLLLERLLAISPQHSLGHLALAKLELRAARQQSANTTYDTVDEARGHLQQAASQAKQDHDADAATAVLEECVAYQQWASAAEVAPLVDQHGGDDSILDDLLFAVQVTQKEV